MTYLLAQKTVFLLVVWNAMSSLLFKKAIHSLLDAHHPLMKLSP